MVVLGLAVIMAVTRTAKADSYNYEFAGTAPDNTLYLSFGIVTSGNTATSGSIDIGDNVGPFTEGVYNLTFGGFLSPTYGEFVFTGAGGTIDLFDVNGTWQIEIDGENATNDALVITPEPSSLLLLGSGLLILAAGLYWTSRFSKFGARKHAEPSLVEVG
jgi:hypothetical protein